MDVLARIEGLVGATGYSCSIGYCHDDGGEKTVEEMFKDADEMMYAAKNIHYEGRGGHGIRAGQPGK